MEIKNNGENTNMRQVEWQVAMAWKSNRKKTQPKTEARKNCGEKNMKKMFHFMNYSLLISVCCTLCAQSIAVEKK